MGEEAYRMEQSGADLLHLDVMDGHFVPNITFGALLIKSIRKYTKIPFDVHLMISEPLKYITDFAAAGSDILNFHVESESPVSKTIECIRNSNCIPALSVKPATDIETVFPYLDTIGMVLIMTVEPGFGGQALMPETLCKIERLRMECKKRNLNIDIQVDGGITNSTIALASKAGANVFVAGNAIFGAESPQKAIAGLRCLAADAVR